MSKTSRERFEADTAGPVTVHRVKINNTVIPEAFKSAEDAWAWACKRGSDGTPPNGTMVYPEKSFATWARDLFKSDEPGA